MQELTIEQLKFARIIGAVYCLKNYQECIDGYFGKPGYVYRGGKWVEWLINEKDGCIFDYLSNPDNRFRIDFSPLDELSTKNDKEQPLEWPEERQDAIGQNGNDGEHYEKPETTHDVSHHKRKDGTDLIDEWWNKYEPEVARVLMWEMVNKYKNRLGKKDPVHIEVAKMADYLARWSEKEFELIK